MKHGSYDSAFKVSVIEYMHDNQLSLNQTVAKFRIPQEATIGKWERIYYEEGPLALLREKRGKRSKMSSYPPKKKLAKETEEDLIAEVQRLHMENEYLKIKRLSSGKNFPREWERTTIIDELRHIYKLADLLAFDGMSRSTLYFYLK